MREIKFRAFLSGQMSRPFFIGEAVCWPDGSIGLIGKKNTIMQYTGLKDVNDTEIYEGDIVLRWSYGWNDGGMGDKLEKAVVVFEENKAGFVNCIDVKKGVEVIGNIYENPDLLKGGDL